MPLTYLKSLGIADGTIVNADINSSAAITLAKLSGVNDAKAWVNFNGTGTVAIRASFNVSSITDNGTGDYTVNLTNAITDANYSYSITSTSSMIANKASSAGWSPGTDQTTSAIRIQSRTGGAVAEDAWSVSVVIFR